MKSFQSDLIQIKNDIIASSHQNDKHIDHHIVINDIVKDVFKNITQVKKNAMEYAIKNRNIDVIKYVSSISGVELHDKLLLTAMRSSKFDIVVCLMNIYLCRSIPSHLHNIQFHIFQYQ